MDVKSNFRYLAGVLAIPLFFSLPIQAQEEPQKEYPLLAGSIGKTSSATARVTLIIPPRPKVKETVDTEKSKAIQKEEHPKKEENTTRE